MHRPRRLPGLVCTIVIVLLAALAAAPVAAASTSVAVSGTAAIDYNWSNVYTAGCDGSECGADVESYASNLSLLGSGWLDLDMNLETPSSGCAAVDTQDSYGTFYSQSNESVYLHFQIAGTVCTGGNGGNGGYVTSGELKLTAGDGTGNLRGITGTLRVLIQGTGGSYLAPTNRAPTTHGNQPNDTYGMETIQGRLTRGGCVSGQVHC